MSMSKKDFVALADVMRTVDGMEHLGDDSPVSKHDVIDRLCLFMRGQNPNFNETRWREYLAGECGPSGGKIKR